MVEFRYYKNRKYLSLNKNYDRLKHKKEKSMVTNMAEKTFTQEEINRKINEYFEPYMRLYMNDKISFAEFALIKGTLTDIQFLFSDLNDGKQFNNGDG